MLILQLGPCQQTSASPWQNQAGMAQMGWQGRVQKGNCVAALMDQGGPLL